MPTTPAIFVGQGKVIAGTAVPVTATRGALSNGLVVKSLGTNTGKVTVGGSNVNNTVDGTGNGYVLNPGDACSFAIMDPSTLYFNGTTSNDVVTFEGN